MNTPNFEPKELTKEKRLWDIYIASRRIPFSRFNTITTAVVFLLLLANSWFTTQPVQETIELVRELSKTGLALALSTLGFLLAGFTIFATVTQPSLSLQMSEIPHPSSGLSYLKHSYFIFIRVFIYYLVFSIFCLLIVIFGHKGGLVPLLASCSPYSEHVKFAVAKASYVFLFTGYYFILIQLKSFIFNIHHSVMTSLRWKAEGYE